MICEVLGCTNRTTDKEKGISFYRFPHDEIIKQKWVDILSRDGWSPNPLGKVCSDHFKPTDWRTSKKVLLRETAIPSILPPLKGEIWSEPISTISSIPADIEMDEDSTNDTFLNPENRLATRKTNKNESIRSNLPFIGELAVDVNSIKSKINIHLKAKRAKNCRLRAKIDKLKRFLIEIKEENTNSNPVLASLFVSATLLAFENALKEPHETAIDPQMNDKESYESNEGELSQPVQLSESAIQGSIKNPFVLHLIDELKKLHSEDFALIKRDIQNILEANNITNSLVMNL